jgi:hypothetical protein
MTEEVVENAVNAPNPLNPPNKLEAEGKLWCGFRRVS